MRKYNKFLTIILAALSVIFLSACREQSPTTAAEEISRYNWSLTGEYGECSLHFDNDTAELSANISAEETIKVRGKYFTDENTITVDTDEYGTVVFAYQLKDDKLILTFCETNITLTKV